MTVVDTATAVYTVVLEVQRLLGSSFPLSALVERVALWRGHPIRIEFDSMPNGMTGYIVPLRDCDLICTKRNLDPIRRTWVILHELSHILLGHVPLLHDDPDTSTYKRFKRNRDYRSAFCRRMKGQEDQDKEIITEMLAGLLIEFIIRGDQLAINIFLDDEE
jgi:hypothetical protein